MIRKAYVDTKKGQVHYRYREGSGVPVVFLHQTASSSAMFEKMMIYWSGSQPLFALDTPGFGGSYDPEDMPSMREYADVLQEAIAGLGLSKVHLFGHHTGASIGVEMVSSAPARFASFSMIGPVTITRDEAAIFSTIYPKDFSLSADGSHLQKMWDYVAEIGGSSSLDLHHREFVDTARAWNGHIKVYKTIWAQDFIALFKRVECPMLIMCSPNDVLWPIFERAKEIRPDAAVVELGGSNFQTDEIPEQVINATTHFLKTVEARSNS